MNIALLVHLLVLCLVLGLVCWIVVTILDNLPGAPVVFRQVAMVALLLIFLLMVLYDVLPLAYGGRP